MEEDVIYCNAEIISTVYPKSQEKGFESSGRRTSSVARFCLGVLCVLLLVGLVCLGGHMVTVTKHLHTCENISSTMGEHLDSVNQELQRLQTQFTGMMFCPVGWVMFGSSCYSFSSSSHSWDDSRKECNKNDADLIIINTAEEQDFIYKISKSTYWIGMSDRDTENNWKWVDGSPVFRKYWDENQPDNGSGDPKYGKENCGAFELTGSPYTSWNDLRCSVSQRWICEKRALVFH